MGPLALCSENDTPQKPSSITCLCPLLASQHAQPTSRAAPQLRAFRLHGLRPAQPITGQQAPTPPLRTVRSQHRYVPPRQDWPPATVLKRAGLSGC